MRQTENASGYRLLPYGLAETIPRYNYKDMQRNEREIISYYLCKTQSMFEYAGLPETIPQRILELYLQRAGHCAILEYNGAYYAIQGGFAGELDYNYMPKQYSTVNPALPGMPALHNIGVNCVVIPNDSLYIGLLPLLSKFASEMCATDISVRLALVNSRATFLLSAPDDNTEKSACLFLADLEKGSQGVIRENAFLDGVKVNPVARTGANSVISALDEHRQYLRGTLYHDLGLDSPFNMKRERINTAETELTQDTLLPYIDDMLKARRLALEQVNAMFHLNISVKLASAWEDEQQERELALEAMEQAVETPEDEPTPDWKSGVQDEQSKNAPE